MHYFPHTFFIVTVNMFLTNVSNHSTFVFIAVYVIIHERTIILKHEVHFSTVLAFVVWVTSTGPGIFIRCHLNAVIAYPCPFPRAVSQTNEIFSNFAPFRFKFFLQKIHFIFILNRNKMAIVPRAQMKAFIPSCSLLCMNSITRTIEFKCQTLNEIKQSVSKHLKLIIYPPGISIAYTV